MNHTAPKSESALEKSARTLRRANQSGDDADHRHAADAQHKLDRPENAKGRPAPDGKPSNAGNDGGA